LLNANCQLLIAMKNGRRSAFGVLGSGFGVRGSGFWVLVLGSGFSRTLFTTPAMFEMPRKATCTERFFCGVRCGLSRARTTKVALGRDSRRFYQESVFNL
jgi:hypothetical protein